METIIADHGACRRVSSRHRRRGHASYRSHHVCLDWPSTGKENNSQQPVESPKPTVGLGTKLYFTVFVSCHLLTITCVNIW